MNTIVIVFFMMTCFIGCAGDTKNAKKDPFFEKWNTLADSSQGHSPQSKSKKLDMPELPVQKNSAICGNREINQKTDDQTGYFDHAPGRT